MISKVFKNGNSQAVRIPKSLHIQSNKVDITKVGDSWIIRELPQSWDDVFKCLQDFSHFMEDGRVDLPTQQRDEFK